MACNACSRILAAASYCWETSSAMLRTAGGLAALLSSSRTQQLGLLPSGLQLLHASTEPFCLWSDLLAFVAELLRGRLRPFGQRSGLYLIFLDRGSFAILQSPVVVFLSHDNATPRSSNPLLLPFSYLGHVASRSSNEFPSDTLSSSSFASAAP